MPAAPKVAYVVYDDGYWAIVSVKLIKDFKPASVADCQKHKEIYWKTNEAGHVDEGYYRGDVILLGATFSDLIQKMGKKRLSVPDTVFYDIESEEETTEKKHWPAVPVAATNAAHLLIMAPMNMRPPTGAFKRKQGRCSSCSHRHRRHHHRRHHYRRHHHYGRARRCLHKGGQQRCLCHRRSTYCYQSLRRLLQSSHGCSHAH
ncbi:uncharacterized protein LOC142776149 isoform X3 [Rhipicephalus microplus]|uniref:uncharacterized protein LOC142776149 isoform X3 n=1 Tax=Rhipicephalus microplus TaxID=6941 RepID=UPI003F6ACCF8